MNLMGLSLQMARAIMRHYYLATLRRLDSLRRMAIRMLTSWQMARPMLKVRQNLTHYLMVKDWQMVKVTQRATRLRFHYLMAK